ncbi:MAG: cation transporter, partial [Gemmatimonadaceae bacterium]
MEHAKLKIEGMSCGHCVSTVESALRTVDGVEVENVAVGSASLDYNPATTDMEKIRAAVSDAGFQVVG